jgi:hypothetical protein
MDGKRCDGKADRKSRERNGGAKKYAQVNRNDEGVPWPGDKPRDASIQSNGGSGAEKESGQSANPNRGEESDDRWPATFGSGAEHEAIDPGIEIAHRPEPLAQLVDVEFFGRLLHGLTLPASAGHELRELTKAVGAFTEWLERAIGGLAKFQGQLPCAVNSAE